MWCPKGLGHVGQPDQRQEQDEQKPPHNVRGRHLVEVSYDKLMRLAADERTFLQSYYTHHMVTQAKHLPPRGTQLGDA